MKRILLLVTVAVVMAALMALSAGSALAHQTHQHQLTTPEPAAEQANEEAGDPLIAQGLCGPANHAAFHNFHNNVHADAPGLDNNGQVEINRTDC